jgi:hypothetical protein
MSVASWLLLYAGSTAFALWVVWGGGAAWLVGWRASVALDWLLAYSWSSEQIALYTLICWVGHTIWFVVGLFVPEARFESLVLP